jgi:hypothetical protein
MYNLTLADLKEKEIYKSGYSSNEYTVNSAGELLYRVDENQRWFPSASTIPDKRFKYKNESLSNPSIFPLTFEGLVENKLYSSTRDPDATYKLDHGQLHYLYPSDTKWCGAVGKHGHFREIIQDTFPELPPCGITVTPVRYPDYQINHHLQPIPNHLIKITELENEIKRLNKIIDKLLGS